MTIVGPEPVILALRQRLADDLAAQVTTLNAGVTDGYTIDPPAAVLDYVPAIGQLVDIPTLGIEEGRLTWQDDTGFDATGIVDLLVVAFVQHAEPEALARINRRTRLAIMRTVLDGSTPRRLDPAWGITFRGSEPGPALEGRWRDGQDSPPHTYLTWTTLGFRFSYDEA